MHHGMRTIVYPVKDLTRAKALYRALLGVEPNMDEAYYVGFRVGEQEIGLDPRGHAQGMSGPVGYWQVEDIERELERLVAAGAQVQQPIKNVGGGRLVAVLGDGEGNAIGLVRG